MSRLAYIICYMDSSKPIFLFDLDGTLTEARKPASTSLGPILRDLSKIAKIFVVTGSDYEFIEEQLSGVWHYLPCSDVVLMPCNGTKRYEWHKAGFGSSFRLVKDLSMKDHLGFDAYRALVSYIIKRQSKFLQKFEESKMCTGRFVSYRGSMINWSPMGRDGDSNSRESFVKHDSKTEYRTKEIKRMRRFIEKNQIPVKVSYGGDTSFDIFPLGWDKTLALEGIEDRNLVFMGDRCEPGGNDFEIFKKVKALGGEAYHVKNPEETMEILKQYIKENK